MRRDEVRVAVKAAVRAFKKTPDAKTLVDAFDDEGIHVYYDEQDVCEAVEVGSPAAPVFDGQSLIGRPFAEVRDWLQARDSDVQLDEAGLTDFEIGLGLYASSAEEEPDDPVEGVIAFRRGYYE
jgi:hypothetical protein